MKKLLALFTLLPLLSWAFPVYTNRLDFDPAQSTGQFDDFLWRWSGFDDQQVELIFRNGISPSNMGFRLAYPQRGKTFLDILPPSITTPTNVTQLTTNSLTVVYNILPVYPTVATPAYSNVYHTDNLLISLDGAVSISNRITTNFIPTVVTNVFAVGGGVTVTGTVGRTTSNLYQDATAVTLVTNTAVAGTPQYFQHTNYVLGVTSVVQVTTSREYLPIGVISGTTNYSLGASLVQNGTFTSSLDGWAAFDENGNATPDIFWNLGRAAVRGTGTIQQVVSGLTIGERYFFSFNASAGNENIVTTYKYGDSQDTLTGSGIGQKIITASANSLVISLSSSVIATNQTIFYDDVVLRPSGTNRFVDTTVTTLTATAQSFTTPYASVSSAITNQAYSVTTNIYNFTSFSIPRLSIPPDGPYFAEVLTYSGSNPTNPTQSRTLAKGQVTIENSLWAITNYAGYTNYPGPWDYLLQDGSRPMAGNLNMGGNAVTNIGTNGLRFASGAYITPTDVATWNSFISSTSGLNAGTVFGGDVTGTYNNLTLRKNALDNMEYLDLTTSPTGTAAVGRMVWNADRETYQFGMDAALTQDIGQQSFAQVKNAESVTISNGMVVYIAGASGDRATVKIASYSNDTLSARTIGIAAEDIGPNGTGFVITGGPKYNQDTSAFSAGSLLWLGAYGNLTTNRPQAPLHGVFIGVAEKINANAGVVFVKVQNGFELDELHDVNLSTPATNDLLIYNGTVWTNYARTNLSGIYLPLAGGTMSGNINMNEQNINGLSGLESIDASKTIYFDSGEISGAWQFLQQPTIPGYLTSTGAAATYVELNNLPAGILTTNNLSTIAGSGLGVVSNRLAVTNAFATTNQLAAYLPLAGGTITGDLTFSGDSLDITGLDTISTITEGTTYQINVFEGSFEGPWQFIQQPIIPGYVATNGSAFGLTNFPSSLLTVSAGNANYWRITTAPTGATSSGQSGQMAVSGTNLYIYSPNALGTGTGRWGRVNLDVSW